MKNSLRKFAPVNPIQLKPEDKYSEYKRLLLSADKQ